MREIAIWFELDIHDEISSDNLATEHRWERLVLDSLLNCSDFDTVYSVLPIWKSSKSKPVKFVNGIDSKKLRELVLVCPNGWPMHLRPKGFVFNCLYDSLSDTSQFRDIEKECNENIILIDPFDNFSRDHGLEKFPTHIKYFEPFFPPRLPYINQNSESVKNNILLWPHKGALDNMKYKTVDMKLIYDWVALKLEQDPSLEFVFLTASLQSSLTFAGYPLLEDFFWNHETTCNLKKYKERVTLHLSLSWKEVLEIYSRTKLMISSQRGGSFTAGSAQESAMQGIPFVLTQEISPWENILSPKLFALWGSLEYFSLMDKLLTDKVFYNQISQDIKNYAYRYTYESFNKNLIAALEKRNMI